MIAHPNLLTTPWVVYRAASNPCYDSPAALLVGLAIAWTDAGPVVAIGAIVEPGMQLDTPRLIEWWRIVGLHPTAQHARTAAEKEMRNP